MVLRFRSQKSIFHVNFRNQIGVKVIFLADSHAWVLVDIGVNRLNRQKADLGLMLNLHTEFLLPKSSYNWTLSIIGIKKLRESESLTPQSSQKSVGRNVNFYAH